MSSTNYKKRVLVYARNSKYKSLFRLLLSMSKAARVAFMGEVKRCITQEVDKLTSPKFRSIWREGFKEGLEVISVFTWDKVFRECETVCPVLTYALMGAFFDRKSKEILSTKISSVIGQIVFARKPTKMKTLQELLGVQLWLSGTSTMVKYNMKPSVSCHFGWFISFVCVFFFFLVLCFVHFLYFFFRLYCLFWLTCLLE